MMSSTPPIHPNSVRLHAHTGTFSTLIFVLIWIGYVLLSPFYVFHSGLPQPSDILLAIGIIPALILAVLNHKDQISGAHITGGLFVILTTAVNLIYYLYTGERSFIAPSLFYLFNFSVFCFIVFLFKQSPVFMNRVTYLSISTIVLIQLFYVIGFSGEGARHAGTFNNPNQLAYWALLMGVILIVLKRGSSLNLFDLLLFSALAYIQTEALSKAGMISYGVLILFMAFQPVANKKLKALFVFGLLFLLITEITAPQEVKKWVIAADNISAAAHRLGKIGSDVDDNPMVRGYSRLIEYPQYLLTGAGEGAHWRFNARQELHSGIATILFSYGVLGFILFFGFLYFVFIRLPLYYAMLLTPLILYGLTHQNFRNTGFWVFLGLCFSYHFFEKKTLEEMREYKPMKSKPKEYHPLDLQIRDKNI